MSAKDIAAARYRALCESDTDLAANICKRVAELPDRSSPDDWPEAMLVTHEELTFIVVDELLTEIDRLVNGSQQATPSVLQECIHKARLRTQDAVRALNDHLATPKGSKNTSANAERLAYLKGVMHGMHQILTDLELKHPVQFEENA